jgi:thiol-disulfide isomerase/thioredoxin
VTSKQPRRRPAAAARGPAGRAPSSSRWWAIGGTAVVLVVAVVIAVAAGGGGGSDGAASAAGKHETGTVVVDGAPLPTYDPTAAKDDAVGDRAPTLHGEGFDGQSVTVGPSEKPHVVMFLAHWCPHCQAEVPRVVTLAEHGAFDGLDVSAVATGTRSDLPNYPPSAWLAREKWPFTVMVDSKTSTGATAYGIPSYPYFVFLGADGTVLGRATGEIAPSALHDILDALRAGKPLPSATGSSSSAG